MYIASSPFSCLSHLWGDKKNKSREWFGKYWNSVFGTVNHLLLQWRYGVQFFWSSDLFDVPSQNNLIRELEHTKKLIEDSHHEKVGDSFSFLTHRLGALNTKWSPNVFRSSCWSRLRPSGLRMTRVGAGATPCCMGKPLTSSYLYTLTCFSDSFLFFLVFFRRSQLVNTPDFRFPVSTSSMMDSNSEHYSGALVQRRPQKGRMAALRDEPSKVSSQALMLGPVWHNRNVSEHLLWLGCCLFPLLCFILS